MCGIAGYISTRGSEVPLELIQGMTDVVAHRGPDGQGVWRHGSVALGHRRLSILDLSVLGHQPMVDADTGCVISYNGEIYNYLELRQELTARGYQFRSHTDTEVILKAYDCWGQACVEKFNGMWAFAIYDRSRNIVFCSRDRFGVKPFYYAELADGFAFGSEIRQLLPLLPHRKVNEQVLFAFLVARVAESTECSFFSGVRKLPGGHSLVFDLATRTHAIVRHYELKARSTYADLNISQAVETFDHLFRDAIRLRLRSDVRVGTCLSGGLDSSSIATLAADSYGTQNSQSFSAITAISEDPATDESQFARRVVEHAGLDWITITPRYDDFRASIDAVVRAQEEPFASASVFMQFFVMREARRLGIPVLLDGQGGDETLLGYDRYFADLLVQNLSGQKPVAAWAVVSGLLKNGQPGALRTLLRNLAYFHAPALRRLATSDQLAVFGAKYVPLIQSVGRMSREHSSIFEMQKQEIECANLPALLRYEDKNSMAHSIETRLPFLDYRLVELATSFGANKNLYDGWSKYVLRSAMQGQMPDQVVWRKNKFGFEAPESRWMHEHTKLIRQAICASRVLIQICGEKNLKDKLPKLNQGLLWRMFSVAMWEKEFAVNDLV